MSDDDDAALPDSCALTHDLTSLQREIDKVRTLPEIYYLGKILADPAGQHATVEVWIRGTHPHYSGRPLGFQFVALQADPDGPGNPVVDVLLLGYCRHVMFDEDNLNDEFWKHIPDTQTFSEVIEFLIKILSRENRESEAHRNFVEMTTRYIPYCLHSELFLSERAPWPMQYGWLSPEITEVLRDPAKPWESLLREEGPGVYSFALFSPTFCCLLVEEVENYGKWAAANGVRVIRPNSMNNYGAVMLYIGLNNLLDALVRTVLSPISATKFPIETTYGGGFNRHHAFHVMYQEGKDRGLDMHTDHSHVTFNASLGKSFTGSSLTFCGLLGAKNHRKVSVTYTHVPTRCVMHLGRMRHGADDIESGERHNLIVWCTNAAYRASKFPEFYWAEEEGVDPVCTSYTHDKDYNTYRPYPPGTAQYRTRAWCPHPAGALTRPF